MTDLFSLPPDEQLAKHAKVFLGAESGPWVRKAALNYISMTISALPIPQVDAAIARLAALCPLQKICDDDGFTLLHLLRAPSAKPINEAAASLVRHGLDPNARTCCGQTPLLAIRKNIFAENVFFLISLGADPHASDTNGRTPLFGCKPEVAEELVKAGADIEARDENGDSPIVYWAKNFAHSADPISLGYARVLLAAGADPWPSNEPIPEGPGGALLRAAVHQKELAALHCPPQAAPKIRL